jgi:oxygen-independent coproporphyrinogen III oxidase
MAGIYIHIPFCRQACYYCDFHFSTNLSSKSELFKGILHEIQLQKDYLTEPINTIYFGGGTPSLASVSELEGILDRIRQTFKVSHAPEVTLEANPDDLTPEKLGHLKSAGINRLSVGIQSFDDRVLKFLNRAHDTHTAAQCIPAARRAGFENISVDLIYAIPGQTSKEWSSNVVKAISLNPEHISAYSLTIEEKTVFGNWSAKGKLAPVGEEISALEFESLATLLENAGYDHYEISNFARPGFHSRHNTSYWTQEKYLGLGPSAHSYNGVTRQYNVSNNHQYISALKNNTIPSTLEILTPQDQINDYLLTTLRTSWGTDLAKLLRDMHYDLLKDHENYVHTLLIKELAILHEDHLVLTRKGKLMADKISSDLFVAP